MLATRIRSRIETMPTRQTVVDHRDVPEAVLGQASEGIDTRLVGAEGVRIPSHPFGYGGRLGVAPDGGETDQVTFGEDADRFVTLDDHHGADTLVAHPGRGHRHGLVGLGRQGRSAHHLGHRADHRAVSHRASCRSSVAPRVRAHCPGAYR